VSLKSVGLFLTSVVLWLDKVLLVQVSVACRGLSLFLSVDIFKLTLTMVGFQVELLTEYNPLP
jgi:hypothetical protein